MDHIGILTKVVQKYPEVVVAGKGIASPMPKRVKDVIVFVGKTRVLIKAPFLTQMEPNPCYEGTQPV